MLSPRNIKQGTSIELRDTDTDAWIPLTIAVVTGAKVECRTLAGEPILTTARTLIKDARLRPRDGSCSDCGYEVHEGPCVERRCSECNADVSSGCSLHPLRPVHVYRRKRYLAEIVEDRPYPTRELAKALRGDLMEQVRALRDAEQPRQGRIMITTTARAEILAAIENAVQLIDALPGARGSR